MAPKPAHNPPRAIGYCRVSTSEQADSGLGLAAQRATIQAEADRRGWELVFIEDAGYSAKTMERPGIERAVALLDAGEYDILTVAKLDRVSRSVIDGATLAKHAQENHWSLVVLDIGLDMSTPSGKLTFNMLLSVAEFERDIIVARTKSALAQRSKDKPRKPRKLAIPEDVAQRILTEREQGRTMAAIAQGLEDDHVPTARPGTHWHASTVRSVLLSQRAAQLREG